MNTLYKIVLTLNATSWMIVVYGIKERWHTRYIPTWMIGIGLLLVPVLLSLLSLVIARKLGSDSLSKCQESFFQHIWVTSLCLYQYQITQQWYSYTV